MQFLSLVVPVDEVCKVLIQQTTLKQICFNLMFEVLILSSCLCSEHSNLGINYHYIASKYNERTSPLAVPS